MIDLFESGEEMNDTTLPEQEGDGWRGDCETEDYIEYLEVTRDG